MGILIKDTFTGINGTVLSNHIPDTGPQWSTITAGDAVLDNNQLKLGVGSSGGTYIPAVPDNGYDSYIQTQVVRDNTGYAFWLGLRTFYNLGIIYNTVRLNCLKYDNSGPGSFAVSIYLGNSLTYYSGFQTHNLNVNDTIQLSVSGPVLSALVDVKVNGISIWSTTKTVPVNGNPYFFITSNSYATYLDNFEYGNNPPLNDSGKRYWKNGQWNVVYKEYDNRRF